MRYQKFLPLLFAVVMAMALSNCRKARPDLVPAKPPGAPDNITGFCGEGNKKVIVVVKNQGNANAPASKITVEFSVRGSIVPVTMDTPAISAGGSTPPITFDIPAGCFGPDCNFKIT